MVTKLQILRVERFRHDVCSECNELICDESEEDMENCFNNLNLGDCGR